MNTLDKVYNLTIDIKNIDVKYNSYAKFFDDDRETSVIRIKLLNDKTPMNLENCIVEAYFILADNTYHNEACKIINSSEGVVELQLCQKCLVKGENIVRLSILKDNEISNTPVITYEVRKGLYSDNPSFNDDPLTPILSQMLLDIKVTKVNQIELQERYEKSLPKIEGKIKEVESLINRVDTAIASGTQDLEVKEARNGEVSLNARLERDLANTNRELEKIKKLEESTVSTVITDSSFTTVSETTGGYFEDVKIEGKTLVNLCTNTQNINLYTEDNKQNKIKLSTSYDLKLGETYSLVVKLSNVVQGTSLNRLAFNFGDSNLDDIYEKTVLLEEGLCIIPFNMGNYSQTSEWFSIRVPSSDISAGARATAEYLLILEGDHTDKDISFFEGLKSVGQDADEISVSSVKGDGNLVEYIELNGVIVSDGEDYTDSVYVRTNYIAVEPNQTYYIKRSTNVLYKNYTVYFYGSNKSYLGSKFSLTSEFTTVADTRFIRIDMAKLDGTDNTQEDIKNCDFVVSKCRVSEYIPHQSDKKQILYYNPNTETWEKPILREWDSIEKHADGKYYYHKRSEEVVLNGSESWWKDLSIGANTTRYGTKIQNAQNTNTSNKLVCNLFACSGVTTYGTDVEDTQIYDNSLYVRINTSKAQDAEGFKAWLQANNVTVVYQLAEEEVYECTNLDLITYQNETNLIVNSGAIQPKITLKVLSNISNIIKLLQEKVSILENKFIKGLKQILAGDMMSLAYLLYPQDFDKDNEVKTLEEL